MQAFRDGIPEPKDVYPCLRGTVPSSIQKHSISLILRGRDVVIVNSVDPNMLLSEIVAPMVDMILRRQNLPLKPGRPHIIIISPSVAAEQVCLLVRVD